MDSEDTPELCAHLQMFEHEIAKHAEEIERLEVADGQVSGFKLSHAELSRRRREIEDHRERLREYERRRSEIWENEGPDREDVSESL